MRKKILCSMIGIGVLFSLSGCQASMDAIQNDLTNSMNNVMGNHTNENSFTKFKGYVKDMNSSNILSSKPYIRGCAKLSYAHIPRNIEQNADIITLRATSGARMIRAILDNDYRLNKFQKDSGSKKSIFKLTSKHVKYSNPQIGSSYFDLSKLDRYDTKEFDMYRVNIFTHLKIPDNLVKKGKVYFLGEKAIQFGQLSKNAKRVATGSDAAMMCFHRLNGKLTSDEEPYPVTVKKGNIVDFRITCYFSGNLEGQAGFGSLSKYIKPKWYVQSTDSDEPTDRYTLTSEDMFLYKSEITKK